MKNVTKCQLEVLMLCAPGPLGEGLSQEEAAERLNITPAAITQRLKHFAKRFPDAYNRYLGWWDVAQEQGRKLKSSYSYDDLLYTDEKDELNITPVDTRIRDKF